MQDSDKPMEELEKALHEIDLMRHSEELGEFEEHWKEFLGRLERVWYKACNHFSKSPKWNGWKGTYGQARKKDILLSYLVNARGADEHTIGEITAREPGGIGINPAEGNSLYIENLEVKSGIVNIESPQKFRIDFIPGRVKLLPVTNRGRVYPVPANHLGNSIDPSNVITIAEIALQYYEKFLDEARTHFVTLTEGKNR
jgi:hypothetical protein